MLYDQFFKVSVCVPCISARFLSLQSASTMWMAYSEQHYPKAIDLTSAISRLRCTFGDLEFDAEHALNYDYRVFLVEEELQRVRDLAENYSEASLVCRLYLDDTISLECLMYELSKLNFQSFINGLADFLPANLKERFVIVHDDDDDGEESQETSYSRNRHVEACSSQSELDDAE